MLSLQMGLQIPNRKQVYKLARRETPSDGHALQEIGLDKIKSG